jgi:RES domain-containing protein
MHVYRLASSRYAGDLSGAGAAMFGGRWNKKGMAVIYTGSTSEIALLEYLVHVPPMIIPAVDMVVLDIPSDSVREIMEETLPDSWRHYPAPAEVREIGVEWVAAGESLALKVPSAILPGSSNFILNVKHPRFAEVKMVDRYAFQIDQRLIKNKHQ